VPGVVINHHPANSGVYIGSPSLVILTNGTYVASHDEFGPNGTNVTWVSRSLDRGQTWRPAAELQGQYGSGLFVHRGGLYIIGQDMAYGDVVIRRSCDGGELRPRRGFC
jgi:hypothetical protein